MVVDCSVPPRNHPRFSCGNWLGVKPPVSLDGPRSAPGRVQPWHCSRGADADVLSQSSGGQGYNHLFPEQHRGPLQVGVHSRRECVRGAFFWNGILEAKSFEKVGHRGTRGVKRSELLAVFSPRSTREPFLSSVHFGLCDWPAGPILACKAKAVKLSFAPLWKKSSSSAPVAPG